MNRDQYDALRDKQVSGKRARLLTPVSNKAGYTLPAGALVSILRKYGGFDIRGMLCESCKVQVAINSVEFTRLDLVSEDSE